MTYLSGCFCLYRNSGDRRRAPGREGMVWELSISEGCGMIVAVRMAGLIVIYDSVMDGRADCRI